MKQLMVLDDERGVFFTTPHFDGYPAVLRRIPEPRGRDRGLARWIALALTTLIAAGLVAGVIAEAVR